MSTSVRTTIVLQDEKLRKLKKLAFEKGTSIGKLINEALDRVFFGKKKAKNFRELRGLWKSRHFSKEDIEGARLRLKEFPS